MARIGNAANKVLPCLSLRDDMTKKLNEEHDQRRLEHLEMQERIENNERAGKAEIQVGESDEMNAFSRGKGGKKPHLSVVIIITLMRWLHSGLS